jgi:hypothetical protein
MPLVKQGKDPHENANGFALNGYLQLVDWAGRVVLENKRGAIPSDTLLVLQRFGHDTERYLVHLRGHAATEKPVMLAISIKSDKRQDLWSAALLRELEQRSGSIGTLKPNNHSFDRLLPSREQSGWFLYGSMRSSRKVNAPYVFHILPCRHPQ